MRPINDWLREGQPPFVPSKLRYVMLKRGFGIDDLAAKLDVPPLAVILWATGRRVPPIDMLGLVVMLTHFPLAFFRKPWLSDGDMTSCSLRLDPRPADINQFLPCCPDLRGPEREIVRQARQGWLYYQILDDPDSRFDALCLAMEAGHQTAADIATWVATTVRETYSVRRAASGLRGLHERGAIGRDGERYHLLTPRAVPAVPGQGRSYVTAI